MVSHTPVNRVLKHYTKGLCCHVRHVHFLGICGSGMAPLAVLASRRSINVTGWDDNPTDACASLQSMGVDTKLSLAGSAMPDVVVASAAIAPHHAELRFARYLTSHSFSTGHG